MKKYIIFLAFVFNIGLSVYAEVNERAEYQKCQEDSAEWVTSYIPAKLEGFLTVESGLSLHNSFIEWVREAYCEFDQGKLSFDVLFSVKIVHGYQTMNLPVFVFSEGVVDPKRKIFVFECVQTPMTGQDECPEEGVLWE